MTTQESLSWLKKHQPLPNDDELTEEIADTYDQIRKHLLVDTDSRCIPLVLNSFGGTNGWGMYQLMDDVLVVYSPQEVIPHLIVGLQSTHAHVRQWNAEIAANFPDSCLVSPLARLLADPNEDVRSGVIIALQQIRDVRVASILEIYLEIETDDHLRALAADWKPII